MGRTPRQTQGDCNGKDRRIAVALSAAEEVEYPHADSEYQSEHNDDADPDRNGLETATEDGLCLADDFFEFGFFRAHRRSQ